MKKVDSHMNFPALEKGILAYWKQEDIFKKSLEKDSSQGNFVFYEGPPTANGKPGLHHVLVRAFKDVIPRYKTMQGYKVERKAGWDTHGLPVELQVEKALGLKNKQDIENIVPGDTRASIIKFNEECKKSVWEYKELWEKLTERMGYWVDMEHPYITYDSNYIESVWWQLKQIAEAGYLYQGHKVVPYCYRCGTALSSHEVAQGYQTVKDNSVFVKFKVKRGEQIKNFTADDNTFFIVWTTTPWTLPGNVALAIRPNAAFSICEMIGENDFSGAPENEKFILSRDLHNIYEGNSKVHSSITYVESQDLVGIRYEKPYPQQDDLEGRVILGGFVTLDSGTGIVHIAPAFGEDDASVAKENNLPTLVTVSDDGKMAEGFPGEGILVKKKNDKNRYAVDDFIIEDLKGRGLLFKEEVYEHEYPFCWRCDTPLIYYAKPSWFIRMSELRDELLEGNKDIQWVPENIQEGRFGEWLRGVKDWAISRERYWGTPLPIWSCNTCEEQIVIGTQEELKGLSGIELDDLHKPYIDDVTWNCTCGGEMIRTPEVLDVWFDSGAMPLAQNGYIGKGEVPNFPADYISEAIDQTRGWFYTLHAIATLLAKKGVVKEHKAYKSVICLGHVMDAQGKKMSKSKGNIIEPFEMFDTYGADALRWFFFSVNQPGLPKKFDPKGMREVQGRVFRMLWNSYSFFTTYASIDNWQAAEVTGQSSIDNLLDQWILDELHQVIGATTNQLENLDIYGATQSIEKFIDKVSNTYIRVSRKRFWKNENDHDKEQAYQVLYTVLVKLSQIMAPFTPFVSEEIYRNLKGSSVHLSEWPRYEKLVNDRLLQEMMYVEEIITEGRRLRSEAKIKVRQPLASLRVSLQEMHPQFKKLIEEELNIKKVEFIEDIPEEQGWIFGKALVARIALHTVLTPELQLEGEMREVIRALQEGRKKAGFNVEDRIMLGYQEKEEVFKVHQEEIAKEVLAMEVHGGELVEAEYTDMVEIEGEQFIFWLKRA